MHVCVCVGVYWVDGWGCDDFVVELTHSKQGHLVRRLISGIFACQ